MKKIRKELGQYKYYLASLLLGEKVKGKFILFAQGRTGSTLLTNLLNSHEEIFANREILGRRGRIGPIFSPYMYADGMSKMKPKNQIVYGFHVKPYQLTENTLVGNVGEWIGRMKDNGYKIIHLWRKNHMRQCLSGRISRKRKKWHDKKSVDKKDIQINVDPSQLKKDIEKRERILKWERKCLDGKKYVEINYEKDIMDKKSQQDTCEKIFDYLKVNIRKVNTDFEKTNRYDTKEVIKNYEVVEQEFLSTKFEKYLHM